MTPEELAELDADVNACLAFLIVNQDKWNPEIAVAHIGGPKGAVLVPLTLVGRVA